MGVFSRANKEDNLTEDGRVKYSTSFDNILVFELNKDMPQYETLNFTEIPDLRKDVVE